MNVVLLTKGDSNIISIEDCKTRMDLFAYTLKLLLPDYMNVTIKNCNQNINDTNYDYIIYINETGFYYEPKKFIQSIKTNKNSKVLSFAISNKFYTFEDIMFGIVQNVTNTNYIYMYPPVNEDLYISRVTDYFCVFFDCTDIYAEQVLTVSEILKQIPDITVMICTINTQIINYYDLNLNLIQTMGFDTYLDYITELSKANMYFVTNICSDIYKLYELSMCNIMVVSHQLFIPTSIVKELDIYTYTNINTINWPQLFNKVQEFNIRDKLIMNNYSWTNAISIITTELNMNISRVLANPVKGNEMNTQIQTTNNNSTKTLNINNHGRPNVSQKKGEINDNNLMEKIYDILEISQKEEVKPQRRLLLQSQILHM
jgi:hypothetical protein